MSSSDMAAYMKQRRWTRRVQILEMLGDQCAECFWNANLEIDHIDPATKRFTLSGKGLDGPWDEILEEVAKCQLLCRPHHTLKSLREDALRRPLEHGSEQMYLKYKCRCHECKSGYADIRRNYPSRQALGR